jgi:UDP-N-acetylglucosamine 4-epimerase
VTADVTATGSHEQILAEVAASPRRWLVTGAAGFIGSHLLETLLAAGQHVTTLDNFATGHRYNYDKVRAAVGEERWRNHVAITGDIADEATCRTACEGVDYVLHEAALGSVPRSLTDPLATHRANATGFLTMLLAARDAKVRRFVYAASSSTYGDSPTLPKVEDVIGRPLSPYAVTKYVDELYAEVFGRSYGMPTIGLRYFNVFGPRQDPNGAYAAVIPRWIASMLEGRECVINGDGETSRDFCYVRNVVQANLRAALTSNAEAIGRVYNVAVGQRTTLNELHAALAAAVEARSPGLRVLLPSHAPFRAGDVRHSLADISLARRLLGYAPSHTIADGMAETVAAY